MAADFLERMGSRIRERRAILGLSRATVAREMAGKVSENQIYRWEKGLHQPNPDTLQELARVLECDVSYFMAAETAKPAETPDPFHANGDIISRLDRIEALLQTIADSTALEDAITRIVAEALGQPLPPVTPPPSESGGEKLPKGRRPPRAA